MVVRHGVSMYNNYICMRWNSFQGLKQYKVYSVQTPTNGYTSESLGSLKKIFNEERNQKYSSSHKLGMQLVRTLVLWLLLFLEVRGIVSICCCCSIVLSKGSKPFM